MVHHRLNAGQTSRMLAQRWFASVHCCLLQLEGHCLHRRRSLESGDKTYISVTCYSHIHPRTKQIPDGPYINLNQYRERFRAQTSKYGATQCCFKARPASYTLDQHQNNIGSVPHDLYYINNYIELFVRGP